MSGPGAVPEGASVRDISIDWKGSEKEGDRTKLEAVVKIGGKNYHMTVGYTKSFLNRLGNPSDHEGAIQKIIERMKENIKEFTEAYKTGTLRIKSDFSKKNPKERWQVEHIVSGRSSKGFQTLGYRKRKYDILTDLYIDQHPDLSADDANDLQGKLQKAEKKYLALSRFVDNFTRGFEVFTKPVETDEKHDEWEEDLLLSLVRVKSSVIEDEEEEDNLMSDEESELTDSSKTSDAGADESYMSDDTSEL